VLKWFDEPAPMLSNTVLTMGNFDGMHQGHRKLFTELLDQARLQNLKPVVLTYLEHPGHYVHFKHPINILTPRTCKKELIRELGIDLIYFLNFTSATAHISAFEFLTEVIVRHFNPKLIISGYDTHFGYQRQGNSEYLKQYEQEFGYQTIQIPPVYYGDEIISSTKIRERLYVGDITIANAMLGKPYRLYGTVTPGIQLGRIIGFPTINLNLMDNEQLIPAGGVYLTSLFIENKRYFGLTNIGTSPTVKTNAQIEIETHVLNFDADIYDENIQLDFLEYIREEKRFNGMEELKQAIAHDVEYGRGLIHKYE
jgi:riboflavin kinase/FMN adenylyltransferase